jgi:hypothetical protein
MSRPAGAVQRLDVQQLLLPLRAFPFGLVAPFASGFRE